ncbi:MAG: RNA polymerase sigma factor [Proteobacteria bacterium]|nr:RNA polymerase sigma factor [Pseudomonadota bacterium]
MAAVDRKQRYEQLLHAHRGIIHNVAYSYSRASSDRDDLAQEICLQLWRSFPGDDSARSFSTWMYRVALNVAISQVRRAYQDDLRRLEPLNRAVIMLYLDERIYSEIAAIAGLSETSVATKISRSKRRLRSHMTNVDTGT